MHEAAAQMYASTGIFLCVAFCRNNNMRYLPRQLTSGKPPSACRYGQEDCLSWGGTTAGLGCSYDDANFNIFKFDSFDECYRFEYVIGNTTASLQAPPSTNAAANTDAQDATCSCHSIVNSFFGAIMDVVPKPGSDALTACTHVKDKIMARLRASVCRTARFDKTRVTGSVCKLVFNVVKDVFEPLERAAVGICASYLQALIDNFGFESSIQGVLTTIRSVGNATRNEMAQSLCGATVCTSSTQKTCSRITNRKQKTALAAAIDSNQGLCKLIK